MHQSLAPAEMREQENSHLQLRRASAPRQAAPTPSPRKLPTISQGKEEAAEKSPLCSQSATNHQLPPPSLEAAMFFLQSKKCPQHHRTSGEMVPDSSLTFLVVRMFSVLMISSKVILYLCPWVKLLVHASKHTRAGISWEVRPINRSLLAMPNVRQLVYQEKLTMQF